MVNGLEILGRGFDFRESKNGRFVPSFPRPTDYPRLGLPLEVAAELTVGVPIIE